MTEPTQEPSPIVREEVTETSTVTVNEGGLEQTDSTERAVEVPDDLISESGNGDAA